MKSPVKTILQALLIVSLFLPVYYSFAARPLDVAELNNGSHSNLNVHGNKILTSENDVSNDADLKNPDSIDIKELFVWSGWTFNPILDSNKDDIIDIKDIPLTYDLEENGGDGDGIIDGNEFKNWLSDAEYVGLAKFYSNEIIPDIPDPDMTGQKAALTSYSVEI